MNTKQENTFSKLAVEILDNFDFDTCLWIRAGLTGIDFDTSEVKTTALMLLRQAYEQDKTINSGCFRAIGNKNKELLRLEFIVTSYEALNDLEEAE